MADVQCKAVVFGGCADDGYARLLLPYSGGQPKSSRIVLIEGPPFAKELAKLKDKFLTVRFPDLFRAAKLMPRRVSFSTTPPPSPSPRAPSYVTTTASAVDTSAVGINSSYQPSANTAIHARQDCTVLKNSKGQRLDAVINQPPVLINLMRSLKLCNQYHILGECSFNSCNFIHGARLNDVQIEARRVVVRQTPCDSGLECKAKNCLLGHQCPDRACPKIGKGCRFPREMHNVSRA